MVRKNYSDIVYYGKCGEGDECWRTHLNDTNGKFTTTSYGSNMWFEGDKPIHTPLAGDFNKDGYTDIAYYGRCDDGKKMLESAPKRYKRQIYDYFLWREYMV